MKDFLSRLIAENIHIGLKEKELTLKIPKSGIDPLLIQEIKQKKGELITYLTELNAIDSEKSTIPNVPLSDNYALSNAQNRMWILNQFEGAVSTYNVFAHFEIHDSFDISSFKRAINAVIDRHEILRTLFKEDDSGNVKQFILNSKTLGFKVNERDFRDNNVPRLAAEEFISGDVYSPFNLAEGPLIRANLLRISEEGYIFYYNMHHIISDEWSMSILSRDIMQYYEHYSKKVPLNLPQLSIQYKDYAAWQLAERDTEAYQKNKEYWLDKFSGELSVIDLPYYQARPLIKTNNGRRLVTCLGNENVSLMREFLEFNGGTLFMFLVASLKTLLFKYTKLENLIIGSPIAGRPHSSLEDQIGFFLNTLPIKSTINGDYNFEEFYDQVKKDLLDDYAHQKYPFDCLIDDLDLVQDNSRSALFDILIVLLNTNENSEDKENSTTDPQIIEDRGKVVAKFDVEMSFEEIGDDIRCGITYNSDVYDQQMIEQLMIHYKRIITSLITNKQSKIKDIEYLSESEHKKLVYDYNETIQHSTYQETIIELFQKQVIDSPDNIALKQNGKSITYRELNNRSNEVARFLLDRNLPPSTNVGILCSRGFEMIIALFGVLKAGHAYVPIDPEYPQNRQLYILQNSKVKFILTDDLSQKKKELLEDMEIVRVSEIKNNTTVKNPDVKIAGDQLAYTIYTSGSTGNPKGVMIEHQSVTNLVNWVNSTFSVNQDDKLLFITSICFDLSVYDIFGILISGGSVIIATKEDIHDFGRLKNILIEEQITFWDSVPTTYNYMIDELEAINQNGNVSSSLRLVFLSGDWIPVMLAERSKNFFPNARVIGLGGATEATVWSNFFPIDKVLPHWKSIPYGIPIDNNFFYVLDDNLLPVPTGVVGELFIGGIGVARGYDNDKDKTTFSFVKDPFNNALGERMYKTGDLGRWLPNGNMEFIGRKDNQVKIRGFRVELGEIDSVLSKYDQLKDSIVNLVKDTNGKNQLCAYLVSSGALDLIEIKNYLRKRLPDYMVPLFYVELDELPLNSNGKIDRKKLPNPDISIRENRFFIAPKTEEEKAVEGVWKQILKIQKISSNDNFYDLGGDSIKSIQTVSRLKQKGYQLDVSDILRTPVLSELANILTKSTHVIDQSIVSGDVLLTPFQKEFLSSDLYVNKSHFNQSIVLEGKTIIDISLLEKSLEYLIEHHDALRMIFKNEEGKWFQENKGIDHKGYSIGFYDLSKSDDYQSEMKDICDTLQSNVNLEQGPLFRVGLFRLKDKDCILLIIHHLVVDGISWRILLEDLENIYKNLATQKAIVLPKKTDSFQRWANLLNTYALSDELSKERLYWDEVLSTKIAPLYQENSHKDVTKGTIRSSHFTLSKEEVELLQTKTHRVYNTQINDLLLTALGISIQKIFENDRVVLDFEGHGREDIIDEVDITRTVGWFTSHYPFVLDIGQESLDLRTSLIQVKESLRKLPNKGVGYGVLRYLGAGFEKELTSSIIFNYLGDFGGASTSIEDEEENLFNYSDEYKGIESSKENNSLGKKLSVSGMLVSGVLQMNITYNDIIYDKKQIFDLLESYKMVLTTMIRELSQEKQSYLTPSDLTYKMLSVSGLSALNKNNNVEDVYELSPLQEGLYYHSSIDNTAYFIQNAYRLYMPEITLDNIHKSYNLLISRHSILRTGFSTTFGTLLQIVHKEVSDTFMYENVSNLPSTEAKELYISEFKSKDRARGFGLEQDSLMRLSIIDLGEGAYELIWSNHHILMDGWCSSILINEFYQILMALESGQEIPLPEVVPYSSYIKWLGKINKESSISYWRDYLSNYSEKATLPFRSIDKSTSKEYIAKQENIIIEDGKLEKLKRVCSQHEITENTLIQSVWGYLLSKYNDTQDVIFGSVVSGRPGSIEGVENMVGLFINTIPVRIRYNNDMTISELLQEQQKTAIESLDHHYLSLSEIQAESLLGVDLLDHIYGFQNYAINELDSDFASADSTKEKLTVVSRQNFIENHYDFDIVVAPLKERIEIKLRYNANVYQKEDISKVKHHLEEILLDFIEHTQMLLKDISYVTESEKSELLYDHDNAKTFFSKEETVVGAFKEQVLKSPDNIAISYNDEQLTYQELDERSDKLAHYLQEKYEVVPNDLIGIMLPVSNWSIVSILAILKSGAAYVPIDPDTPIQRVQYLIDDTKIKTLVVLSGDQEKANEYKVDISIIDTVWESLKQAKAVSSLNIPKSKELAYVIYTSGSTGQPKGVMITHDNLIDYIQGIFEETDVKTCDSFALMSNIATDLGNTVLYSSLLSGGTLYLPEKETLRNADDIHDYFRKYSIDCIKIVPTHWKALTKGNELLLPKQMIIFGGDVLPVSHVTAIKECNPKLRIINHYGPTETTIGKLLINIDNNISYPNIPIGKPFSQTSVYVVDNQLNLCSAGVPGELLIGGRGVAKGYLNNRDLSQKQFIQNPFTSKKDRLYRTGDLVKMLPNGNIEFVGRKDNQVKVRGYRIELGDIENALLSKKEIDTAVVLVKESDSGDKDLVAYYNDNTGVIEVSLLRSYLHEYLPSYMIPSHFVPLQEFPLTANGKIDKKALPNPEDSILSGGKEYIAPRNKREQVLVEVWESVLKREGIGMNDNFYDLGGDSIKCILIVSRLKQRGYGLKVPDLMQTPVLSKLERKLTEIIRTKDQSIVTGDVLLTPIQKSFLSSDYYIDKSHYNQSVILESTSKIDPSLLEKNLKYLVDHHDTLRMVFSNKEGKWHQENKDLKHKGYSLDFYDLSKSEDYQSEMKVLCDTLQSSINLKKGPLLKVGLFRLKDKDCILLIIHHLVVDGVSWRILLEDLGNVYENLVKQETVNLPKKTDSFQRWAGLLNTYALSEELSKEQLYWNKVLSSIVSPLYSEANFGDLSKGTIRSTHFSLTKEEVELLQTKTHRVYNTEINDILLTALGISIQKVFGEDHVVLDLEGHGRESVIEGVDITRTIGWFSSLYPFVLHIGQEPSDFKASLVQVKESLRRLPNKGVGYGVLRYLGTGFEKELSSSIVFNYLGDFGSTVADTEDKEKGMFRFSNEYKGIESSKENNGLGKKMRISGMLVNGVLQMNITYNDMIYDQKQIFDLMESYKLVLKTMIEQLSQEIQSCLTPSDLTYKKLSVSDLFVLNKYNKIEDVYEVSPLQEGLYYHWISSTDKTTYIAQRSYRLRMPEITLGNIRKSYEQLISRHSILRTGFSTAYGILLQIVRKEVTSTFAYEDISIMFSDEAKELYVSDFKLKDRTRGFAVEQDSLMRLSVLDLGDGMYEFIWSNHHILMDGWCSSILINEFYQILMSLEAGKTISLPEVIPYSIYIQWLEKINKDSSISYWKDYLSDYNEKATLPFKSIDKKISEDYIARQEIIKIDTEKLKKLRKICSQNKITESTFIQSAWGYLLSKYNNTQDAVYGSVVSGRPGEIEGVEHMVGLFINTIPVRVNYNGDMTVIDLLNKQQEDSISSLDHHYLGLSEIRAESSLGVDLLDHIYVFENYAINELDTDFIETNGGNEKLSVVSGQNYNETHYDFDILVAPAKDYIEIRLRYNGNVYEKADIIQIQNHLKNVLSDFIEDTQMLLKDVSYITEIERFKLLHDFNNTKLPYPKNETIVDLVKEQVRKNPDNIAVVFENKEMTYQELDEYSNRFSHYLQKKYALAPDNLIAIKLDRGEWMIISILGVLKIGGAYVPLDIQYPEERLQYIQNDSKYKVCIDKQFISNFIVDGASYSKKEVDLQVKDTNLAYGIYTSGSTGNPKGVINSHAGLYNRLLWMRDNLGITQNDIILQKTPYTFDVSVWELLMPSIVGCRLVFAKPEGHKDPKYLQELIDKTKVSIVHFVPSMLSIFLEHLESETCKSLSHVICSGEALPSRTVEEFKRKLPWVRIHNLYGPTEAAIDVTSIELTGVNTSKQGITIGKPVANTKIFIVDKHLSPQPIGVPGELLIEGIQVANGYLNRPDLNEEKFIPSPFTEDEQVYRTGDLAKWLPNGEIAYIGRIDNQVKIRGNRVELGEIETKMQSSGYVNNVVVLIKESENYHKYLIGYVVPNEDYTENELYDYLKDHLPDYMIPSRILTLDEFPLTSNGKINRKSLLGIEEVKDNSTQYVAPQTEIEISMVAIWEEVLKFEGIGIYDNFFRIGGDSILSIRLISKINKLYNVELNITQLYEFNTVESLCSLVEQGAATFAKKQSIKEDIIEDIRGLKDSVFAVIDSPEEIEDVYPMTDIQKGMVILSELNPGEGVYHDQFLFQIPTVNKQLFKKAFSKLVWKHASLRTHFDLATYSKSVQIVKREVDFTIDYKYLKDLGAQEKEEYIHEYMLSERNNPFRTDSGLLWRISMFEINNTASIFLFQFHHAILDGWSVASLNTELFQIYRKLEKEPSLEVEQLKVTYRDAVIEELYDKKDIKVADFWKTELTEYKRLDIFNNKKEDQIVTKVYNFDFKHKLENKCKNDEVTMKTVVYGAFVYALNIINYENDFVIGMVTNNRPTVEDGDKLLGCFLNTIPVRNKLDEVLPISLSEYFKKTEKDLTRIRKNERLTLYEISKIMNENSAGDSPFFDVMFNYVNFHVYNALELGTDKDYKESQEEEIQKDSFLLTNTAFDFTANALGNSLTLKYKLKRGLKNNVTLEKIHQYIEIILSNYVENSEVKIKDIDYLTSQEKQLLLNELNNTTLVSQEDRTIVDLFREQVQKTPDSIAVFFKNTELSYRDIDERSDKLAYYLKEKYMIVPNDLIGVMIPVSHWSVVSILAILKSGAAYVPIDPDMPVERIQYLIEDTKVKTVITISDNQEKIKESNVDTFTIDKVWSTLEDKETIPQLNLSGQSDLAYVIYTSGSTGQPKGVMITHANLVDYINGLFDQTDIKASKSFALMSNIATDLGNTVLYGALLSGGTLHLPQKETLLIAEDIHEYFVNHSIDCIKIVPTHWMALTKYDNLLLPNRMIIFGGDVLPVNYVEAIKKENPELHVVNHYGPTETTVGKLLTNIDSDTSYSNIPIGKPFSQTSIYIVDKQFKLCPIGIPGELLIGGKGVAKGYHNNPDLTQKHFIQNPFVDRNETLYRTGDLVKMLPDGNIEFIGRKDSQIKIRGYRIELGEIESRIQSFEFVENTTVVVKSTESGRKHLVGYVIPKEGYATDTLYTYLTTQLPDYMIPSRILTLEEFPLTANGKINKQELIDLEYDQDTLEQLVAPRNETEASLVSIWEKVLEYKGVGVQDNFFRIGGDSLLVVKLKHELEKKYDDSINIVDLFNYTTIEEQAKLFMKNDELTEVPEIDEIKF